jgi:hypothetical protein
MITKNDISLEYVDIMFEITRFCNMACPHCIRGEAEKRRIKKDYINATLQQIPMIGTIMFTGGEPALAVDLMNYTLDACQHYNVEVSNFWMATNGTIASQKFFNSIERWVSYCTENEISGLRVSIDEYHDEIDNRYVFEEFAEYGLPEDTGVKIYVEFQGAPHEDNLIGEGRAYYNYATTRTVAHNIHLYDDGRIEGSLYINAKGFVLTTCDISYETSDAKNSEFVICHYTNDIQEKVAEFFNAHPELVYKD